MRAPWRDFDRLAGVVSTGASDADIASWWGCSPQTILRWRTALGIPSAWTPIPAPCGTPSAYRRGCRCSDCRDNHAARQRAYRRRRALRRPPTTR